jgi:hypothetical protein
MMTKSTVKKERSDIFKLLAFDYQYVIPGTGSGNEEAKVVEGGLSKWEKLEIEHS